ncbi:MAG TPA: ABC transporter permease [Pirellulales bacterium]|nr:ABC transporter permease [Pirellulales bacterium]
MVLETEPVPFSDFFAASLPYWLKGMAVLALVCLAVGLLRLAVRYGVSRAFWRLADSTVGYVADLFRMSPRRVLALARLTVQESLRRKALAGFGVFVLILLFALWFLDNASPDPAPLYTGFVMNFTSYLVAVMALLLSVFSIPGDIKSRIIFTIVTKPVRASEFVAGRMLGFVAIGTLMLALMGLTSYLFVIRSLDHTHEFEPDTAVLADESAGLGSKVIGTTSLVHNHRHRVILGVDGALATDVSQGHWHPVTVEQHAGRQRYVVGPPQGQFHARVPLYGTLRFKNRYGGDATRGTNVGNEWTYRSHVEGGTLAAAIWRFEGLRREAFPQGLPMDMTIRVFRTEKGDIERGILGSFVLRNPQTGLMTQPQDFVAKEYVTDRHLIPNRLLDSSGKSIELFGELITDGQLDVQLQCLQRRQFFGMAQPDLYLLEHDGSVGLNFVKGYASIWLQMVLITALGVMWSTFLNGPVAMLATFASLVAGFFHHFFESIATGKNPGGATFESLVRMAQHKNTVVKLEPGWSTSIVELLDGGVRHIMRLITQMVPDIRALGDVDYVVAGFNVPDGQLLVQAVTVAAYVLPIFLLGYLFFRLREVAQ